MTEPKQLYKVETDITVQPEGYVNCKCCGAILGYKACVDGVLYLYVFAYTLKHVSFSLERRAVSNRTIGGDVYCRRCGEWQRYPYAP